jgi:hypothetical protein
MRPSPFLLDNAASNRPIVAAADDNDDKTIGGMMIERV